MLVCSGGAETLVSMWEIQRDEPVWCVTRTLHCMLSLSKQARRCCPERSRFCLVSDLDIMNAEWSRNVYPGCQQ